VLSADLDDSLLVGESLARLDRGGVDQQKVSDLLIDSNEPIGCLLDEGLEVAS